MKITLLLFAGALIMATILVLKELSEYLRERSAYERMSRVLLIPAGTITAYSVQEIERFSGAKVILTMREHGTTPEVGD